MGRADVLGAGAARARATTPSPIYIAPEDVKILYPDRPALGSLAVNQFDGVVTNVDDRRDIRIIRLRLANGQELEARGAGYFYREIDLRPGASISVAVRLEGVRILREEGPCYESQRNARPRRSRSSPASSRRAPRGAAA